MLIDQTHTQESRQSQNLREAERHEAELWMRALESGQTAAEIASATGLSERTVYRRLAQARASRGETPETTATPEPSELPRLVLTDTETPGAAANGLAYSLATDAVSLDGGSTWIPPDDPSTPRMPVLVSDRNGRGLRKQFLEPPPFTKPPDPPKIGGLPANSELKGGRGS